MEHAGATKEQNNWALLESQKLIREQYVESIQAGIAECYIHYTKYYHSNSTDKNASHHQAELDRVADAVLPLAVVVDNASLAEDANVSGYFLTRIHPDTGVEITTEDGESMVWVADMYPDGRIYDKPSPYFTRAQIEIVFKQAKALEAANLTVQLS